MAKFLFTMAEEEAKTTEEHFAVRFPVDEFDCYDFANGLKNLGHEVYFVNWRDLDLFHARFTRMFNDNEKRFVEPLAIEAFDLVLVYKMEGFLFNLPRFLAMVALFEKRCRVVVNHPDTIRNNVDKRYLWQLAEKGIRVPKTLSIGTEIEKRLRLGESWVLKPQRGERGYGTLLATNLAALSEIAGKESDYLAQEYLPEIRDGERSLVFLGFEYQHAVLKKPSRTNAQEFRCNESLGGTVEVYTPTSQELAYATSVLQAYASLGCPVHFSRIDFVNGKRGPTLVEAELLNPSIYANYSNRGPEFGHKIAAYFDGLINRSRLIPARLRTVGTGGGIIQHSVAQEERLSG
jgi:glutathione synthase/RimK-type ligase-like ATP-grasp enzyme